MDPPLELEVHSDHLHIKLSPDMVIDAGSTQDLWEYVGNACAEHGHSKVLIESAARERRMDMTTAFDSARTLAKHTSGLTVAFCFHNLKFDELTTFFKTVAQNRGAKVEFFSDLGEAAKWLGVESVKLAEHPGKAG